MPDGPPDPESGSGNSSPRVIITKVHNQPIHLDPITGQVDRRFRLSGKLPLHPYLTAILEIGILSTNKLTDNIRYCTFPSPCHARHCRGLLCLLQQRESWWPA
jgi:hypothetical protein